MQWMTLLMMISDKHLPVLNVIILRMVDSSKLKNNYFEV
jgi:hypothetical protein